MNDQEGDFSRKRSRPFVSADNALPILSCPRCRSENLHHLDVVVFGQRSLDETMVRRTVISDGKDVTNEVVDSTLFGNPSRDRDGIVINFYCEQCSWHNDDGPENPDEMQLTIFQHKGSTFLEWRYTLRKVSDVCPTCEGPMVVRYSNSRYATELEFLSCAKFPVCKGKRQKL